MRKRGPSRGGDFATQLPPRLLDSPFGHTPPLLRFVLGKAPLLGHIEVDKKDIVVAARRAPEQSIAAYPPGDIGIVVDNVDAPRKDSFV